MRKRTENNIIKSVFVSQAEYAEIDGNKVRSIITGSVGACLVIIIYNKATKLTVFAHIDDHTQLELVSTMFLPFETADKADLQVYLVGGWKNNPSSSQKFEYAMGFFINKVGEERISSSYAMQRESRCINFRSDKYDVLPANTMGEKLKYYYPSVGFNCETGKLQISDKPLDDKINDLSRTHIYLSYNAKVKHLYKRGGFGSMPIYKANFDELGNFAFCAQEIYDDQDNLKILDKFIVAFDDQTKQFNIGQLKHSLAFKAISAVGIGVLSSIYFSSVATVAVCTVASIALVHELYKFSFDIDMIKKTHHILGVDGQKAFEMSFS